MKIYIQLAHNILHFPFLGRLTAILPLGGLGAEPTGLPPRITDLTLCNFFLTFWGKHEVYQSKVSNAL
jgi:hypothetical protein